MNIHMSEEAIGAVIRADLQGVPRTAMKPLYVARNTIGVDLDVPIHRIVQTDHLLGDIKQAQLTHSRICRKLWDGAAENPMLGRTFQLPETGEAFTFDGVLRDMFGSCWSLTALDTAGSWGYFSRGKPSVRIESTPRKLLSAVMNIDNRTYDVQHAIAQVQYELEEEVEAYFKDPNFDKHLDSLGQGILVAVTTLLTRHQSEREVRLLCNYLPNEAWVQAHVRLEGDHLRVPFDWTDVIRSVVTGPLVPDGGQQALADQLQSLGIDCVISSSDKRAHSG